MPAYLVQLTYSTTILVFNNVQKVLKYQNKVRNALLKDYNAHLVMELMLKESLAFLRLKYARMGI